MAAEDSYPVIPGSSIFRRVVEQAAATALAHGSAVMGIAIDESAPPPKAQSIPEDRDAKPGSDKEDLEMFVLKGAAGSGDERVDAALRDAMKLAARIPAGAGPADSANGDGTMSVEEVIDLTQSEDDLPFVEHRPPSRSNGTGDLVISAINQTNFDIDSSQMEFSGDVQVKSPRFALRSDRFIVYLKPDGSGMAYGEAIGNVYIRMQKDGKPTGHEGFASRAIYRPEPGKLTLSGWPKIRQQHKEHVAATEDTQMVLYTDGRVKTLGRNRTVIRN